ncbi:hypothetical protein BYT27DRAFT_7184167, partial [Phlegmacium glaucopus]
MPVFESLVKRKPELDLILSVNMLVLLDLSITSSGLFVGFTSIVRCHCLFHNFDRLKVAFNLRLNMFTISSFPRALTHPIHFSAAVWGVETFEVSNSQENRHSYAHFSTML